MIVPSWFPGDGVRDHGVRAAVVPIDALELRSGGATY
jgi:hypothetical protein